MQDDRLLRDIGEKVAIAQIIKPLLNPRGDLNSIGDDCAVIETAGDALVCVSTDRIPADLVSYKLGIIGFYGLGYYLAVLNLSDIAAMGARPSGLLLNLALPENTRVDALIALLEGAKAACDLYGTAVIGGDLSSADELSLSGTSLGLAPGSRVLRRVGAQAGDAVYCSDDIGLTATAFAYFLHARPRGLQLDATSEDVLKNQFRRPRARFDLTRQLVEDSRRITAMDNTDGAGQTLLELAELNGLGIVLWENVIPLHPITTEVAAFLGERALDLALGPGADFQILGFMEAGVGLNEAAARYGLTIIGETMEGSGVSGLSDDGSVCPLNVTGWNYYSRLERDLTGMT